MLNLRLEFPVGVFYTSLLNWCNWHSCCDFSRLQMWLQFDEVKLPQNVNQYDYINVYRHSRFFSWMSFCFKNTKFTQI